MVGNQQIITPAALSQNAEIRTTLHPQQQTSEWFRHFLAHLLLLLILGQFGPMSFDDFANNFEMCPCPLGIAGIFNPLAPPPVTGMQVQFQPLLQTVEAAPPTLQQLPHIDSVHFSAPNQNAAIRSNIIRSPHIDQHQHQHQLAPPMQLQHPPKPNGMSYAAPPANIGQPPPPQQMMHMPPPMVC